jgi:hypothetical protein
MKPELVVSIIGVVISIGLVLAAYFGFIADLKEKVGRLLGINFEDIFRRLSALETGLVAVQTKIGSVNLSDLAAKMDIFWGSMDGVLKGMLHHPDLEHYRKDELLEGFPDLTLDEMCELRDLITKEKVEMLSTKDCCDRSYLLCLALMQARIETVLVDLKLSCERKAQM